MTTSDWIIDIVLILIVVRQLREEKLTKRFVIIPAGIVAYVAHSYLHSIPTGGHDLVLIIAGVLLGSTLGLLGGLWTRVRASEGVAYVQAGPAAAGLWIASMSARLAFIIWITHSSGEATIGRFSAAHHITSGNTWQDALVLLALSEVIVRIATIVIRGHLAVAANPAPVTAEQPVTTTAR
jgi:hypothetical protein